MCLLYFVFDIFVENGLKKFQFRHGIAPTGVLDDATMDALNTPVEDKLKILGANKTRLLNYMSGLGSKHIFVAVNTQQSESVAVVFLQARIIKNTYWQ